MMKTFAIRLRPGEDLKKSLESFVKDKSIQAGFIITCVGSLKEANLRMANELIVTSFKENFEIVSLVGTLSQDGVHLHISLSDKDGKMVGGHLKEGNIVRTTAEVVIGECEDKKFSRVFDIETKFKELKVEE